MADLTINTEVKNGKQSVKTINDFADAAKRAASAATSFQDAAKKISSPKSIGEYSREVSELQRELKDAKRDISSLEKEITKLNKSIKDNTSSTKKAASANSSFSKTMKTIRAAALGYATVIATMKFQEFITNTIQAGVELDSLQRSFKAITGDADLASKQMQFVANVSKNLGLELTTLEQSYKGILAASKNTTLEGEGVQKVFLAINKASAVLGMSSDDTAGSLRALSQMISKGNVQAEELRGQLGERLPGAFQMAAEAMGVSTMKLNDMLENGEVLASDLLPRLADVLEKRFGDAAESASDRAQAKFNEFTNAVTNFQRVIGKSGLTDFMANLAELSANALSALTKLMEGPSEEEELKRKINEASDALKKLRGEADPAPVLELNESMKDYAESLQAATLQGEAYSRSGTGVLDLLSQTTRGAKESSGQIRVLAEEDYEAEIASMRLKLSLVKLTDAHEKLDKAVTGTTSSYKGVAEVMKNEAKSLEKVNNEIAKSFSDGIEASRRKEIDAAKKKAKELKKLAEEELSLGINVAAKKEEIDRKLADKIIEINQEAEQKRIDLAEKRLAQEKKESEKRLKLAQEEGNKKHAIEIAAGKAMQKDSWLLRKEGLERSLEYAEKAQTKSTEAEYKAQQKALKKQQKQWEKTYEDMRDFAADTFYDIFSGELDSFSDFADGMMDIFRRMLANMAAEAAMAEIFKPIMENISSGDSFNLGSLTGSGSGSGINLDSIVSAGKSLYGYFGGGTVAAGTSSTSIAAIASEYGISLTEASLMAQSGVGTGSAAVSSTGASGGSGVAGTGVGVGTIVGAAIMLQHYLTSKNDRVYEGQPTGDAFTGNFGTEPWFAYLNNKLGFGATAGERFDAAIKNQDYQLAAERSGGMMNYWAAPDLAFLQTMMGGLGEKVFGETGGWVFNPIGSAFDWAGGSEPDPRIGFRTANLAGGGPGEGVSSQFDFSPWLQDIGNRDAIGNAVRALFDARFNDIQDTFDVSINEILGDKSLDIRKNPEDFDNDIMKTISGLETSVFEQIQEGLIDAIFPELSGLLSDDFFTSLTAEGQSAFDTFTQFGAIIQNTDDFMVEFTRRIEGLGESSIDAFTNLGLINNVISEVDAAIQATTKASTSTALLDINKTWDELIKTLRIANASIAQVTKVEEGRNAAIGTAITGLTATNIAKTISSIDLSKQLDNVLSDMAGSMIAEQIAEKYFIPINEKIGKVYEESGGDLVAVMEAIQAIDLSEAQNEIDSLNNSLGILTDTFIDSIKAFNYSLQDIINEGTLSDYEYSIVKLNEWYQEQAAEAIELGLNLDLVNEAYAVQRKEIEETQLLLEQSNLTDSLEDRIDLLEDERDLLDDVLNKAKEDYLDALGREIDKQEDLRDAAEDASEAFSSFADDLLDARNSILGIALPETQQTQLSKSMYEDALEKALSGDKDALEALPKLAEEFVKQARLTTGSNDTFEEIARTVNQQLSSTALVAMEEAAKQNTILSNAESQLAVLEEEKSLVEGTNTILMTLAEASAAYYAADLARSGSDIDAQIADLMSTIVQIGTTPTIPNIPSPPPVDTPISLDPYYSSIVTSGYLSEFGRLPEQAGLEYWVKALEDATSGITPQNLNASLGAGALTQDIEYYRSIITKSYQELFNRAPDQAGLEYWVAALMNPSLDYTPQNIKQKIMEGATGSDLTALQSFSGGGIATGPSSGYLAELHDTEAVIPMPGGNIPVQFTGTDNNSETITKLVSILESLLGVSGLMNRDQAEILDILRRVTQNNTYIRTKEVV